MARQIGYGAYWNDEDWPEEALRRRSSRTGRFMEGSRRRGRERMYDDDDYEDREYEGRSRSRRGFRSERSRGESRSRRGAGRDGYD